MTHRQNPRDKQQEQSAMVVNDRNQLGDTAPTQLNQGQRSPHSRHDRESQVGSGNQTQSRTHKP